MVKKKGGGGGPGAPSSGEKPELVLQGVNGDTKEGILLMYFKFEHCCLTEGAVKVQPVCHLVKLINQHMLSNIYSSCI